MLVSQYYIEPLNADEANFAAAVNAGILGTLGYFAYLHWDAPRWDRRTVSAISVGLLALWTGEG